MLLRSPFPLDSFTPPPPPPPPPRLLPPPLLLLLLVPLLLFVLLLLLVVEEGGFLAGLGVANSTVVAAVAASLSALAGVDDVVITRPNDSSKSDST